MLYSSFQYFGGIPNKTFIPLTLIGYEMIVTNWALHTLFAIYNFISNVRS